PPATTMAWLAVRGWRSGRSRCRLAMRSRCWPPSSTGSAPSPPSSRRWPRAMPPEPTVLADGESVARAAVAGVVESCAAAGERYAICLAGGSTPQTVYRLLASDEYRDRIEWERWHVFFGDERQVPLNDPRSNFGNARESLLRHVPIAGGKIH